MTSKNQIEARLQRLETAPRRQHTVQMMSDNELCRIIGIEHPTDEQLMGIIEGRV